MTENEAFYAVSTVAQTLGAVIGIGGTFYVYRLQQAQAVSDEHARFIWTLPITPLEKIEWMNELSEENVGAGMRRFKALLPGLSEHAIGGIIAAHQYVPLASRFVRITRGWFIATLAFGVPTICACLLLLPAASAFACDAPLVIWALALSGCVAVSCFAFTVWLSLQAIIVPPDIQRAVQKGISDAWGS